ncbi:MAG: ATP-binding protein [Sciscionella sp.]
MPPSQGEVLYRLVSERTTSGAPTALTANRQPSDWYPLFPGAALTESLLDRLIDASHQVFLNGPSNRPNSRDPGRTLDTRSGGRVDGHRAESALFIGR